VKAFRRWLIYRRLLDELAEAPQCTLAELGVSRKAIARSRLALGGYRGWFDHAATGPP